VKKTPELSALGANGYDEVGISATRSRELESSTFNFLEKAWLEYGEAGRSGMTIPRTFNVYCDESCHLEHDHIPVMAWGAIFCPADESRAVAESVRSLKAQHGLASNFEAKWTKVSPAQAAFYLDLVELFLDDERLRFRGLLVPNKSLLDHARFDQTHDDWYYKMYFTMLRPIFTAPHRYRVYLDVKDTHGGPKTHKLHEVLANSLYDFNRECIERVQQVRSHESELLQLADLLIGALTYANRGLASSPAKIAIIERLRARLGQQALTRTSAFAAVKFNILVWRSQEAAV
jgi:hypothetical protein